jgi:4-aminobutyrate aminotransferase-like enzyme
VRVKGLAIAVEFKDSDYAEKLADRCHKNGLLLTTSDNALTMFPPLNIDEELVRDGLSIIARAAAAGN